MTNDGDRRGRWGPYAIAAGLLAVAVAGNLAAALDRQLRAGEPVSPQVPLVDEISSALVWLALAPLIARAFAALRPPRAPLPAAIALHVVLASIASLVHYGLTRLLRIPAYLAMGLDQRLDLSWDGYLADLYRDVLTYLLLGLVCWGAGALLAARAKARETPAPAPDVLEVRDGAQTRYLPVGEILWAEAAGNYVELNVAGGRKVLMRATLANLAQRLEAAGFLRVHRSRLVNMTAVAAVENLPAGDAVLVLSDGGRVTASRRYRPSLALALAKRAAA
ncbi:hypothetical protein DDF62_05890 [Caulobacter radicis]|uniref:LytTR family DNA-binding domain-containing protein n=1 Tax=Caulobacter radicis TaxID=2172650 RepID=UPI000D57BD6A|nr:LytTR family DNA-binding domain-containing protein [Caulobacter radicis]PVM91562.1 hypothetical protein DDF62_05890 [Caulobacter radicis]